MKQKNESEALNKAFDSDELKLNNIIEWEAHEHICKGNVCYAVMNDCEVEEV